MKLNLTNDLTIPEGYPIHLKCIPITSWEDFNNLKCFDPVKIKCQRCFNSFDVQKTRIQTCVNDFDGKQYKRKRSYKYEYCSQECRNGEHIGSKEYDCSNCGKKIKKRAGHNNVFKNQFCDRKCFGEHLSEHGDERNVVKYQRSKAEQWFEEVLTKRYKFRVKYNDKSQIKKELDIYIPHLNIAFEINGPTHYEPIFGQDALDRTIKGDKLKARRCHEKYIDLFPIDISKSGHFFKCRFEKHMREIIFIIDTMAEEKGLDYYLHDGEKPFEFYHDGNPGRENGRKKKDGICTMWETRRKKKLSQLV